MIVLKRIAGIVALVLIVGFGVAACSKKTPAIAPPPPPMPTAPAPPPPPQPPPPAPPPPTTQAPLTEEQIFAQKSLDQLNAERPLMDVFFDLDSSTIREDSRGSLQKNADWMKRWTSTRVTVEGHCDERGSAEYNLALGERRANAVKAYLVGLGIPGDRVAIVSKGEEAPVCTDHNDACWQQNRRGHFMITAK